MKLHYKNNKKNGGLKMKKNKIVLALVFSIITLMSTGCASSNSVNKATNNHIQKTNSTVSNNQLPTGKDSDGDGIPDNSEKLLGTNPHSADTDGDLQNDKIDKNPTFAANPIKESSKMNLPLKIKDAKVEDNANADHLEITLVNSGKESLKNFEIYYTITDKVNNKKETYYQKLEGLSILQGETKTIHFDNDIKQAGHYFGNMNGLYGTSKNGLTFDVLLHNVGYQPLSFKVQKAKGTAEVAD